MFAHMVAGPGSLPARPPSGPFGGLIARDKPTIDEVNIAFPGEGLEPTPRGA